MDRGSLSATIGVRTADLLDIRPELVSGLPRISLLGRMRLDVEHHRGITEYSQGKVSVRTQAGLLCVTGSSLLLEEVSADRIRIKGLISGMAFAQPGDSSDGA